MLKHVNRATEVSSSVLKHSQKSKSKLEDRATNTTKTHRRVFIPFGTTLPTRPTLQGDRH